MVLFLLFIVSALCQKYIVDGNVEETKNGLHAKLVLDSSSMYFAPPDVIKNLELNVYYETKERLRVKITDPNEKRWEVPEVVISETPTSSPNEMDYVISIAKNPFSIKITRKSDGATLFDTEGFDFFYANQYIEMSTKLDESDPNIYGLGERVHNFRLDTSNSTYVIFNRDHGTPVNENLYGHHSFYLQLLKTGKSHGVFYLNSNAQEFEINGPKQTFRTIGGILDLFFFTGEAPKDVVKQFLEVIGKPFLPPLWGLGYHQCRWGYNTLQQTEEVVEKFAENKIPLETMWNDIDFMDAYKDFTTDPTRFPADQFREFITKLHNNNQHYMQILDPGIKNETGYGPYERGEKLDIFIKQNDNVHDLVNKVWPGFTVYPDLYKEKGVQYFKDELTRYFQNYIELDGIWIDMNELSGFCDGACSNSAASKKARSNGFDPMNPPYVPGGVNLNDHTIRMDAMTGAGVEYNVHDLYGFIESSVTQSFLEEYTKKRAFVISRSTYSGQGRYGGHWLGDNNSQFSDLFYSISGCLSMSLFGISTCGADICGFGGNTTEELCTRWMELGSFYPFMRNHNGIDQLSQEPYAFGKTLLDTSINVIGQRYVLLPFFYTNLYLSHVNGEVTYRPIFFEFPSDSSGLLPYLDKQFMIGDALMVSPVVESGKTTVDIYVPDDLWFDYYTGQELVGATASPCSKTMSMCTLQAPLESINVHVRGGKVIPRKTKYEMTVKETMENNYDVLVALKEGTAAGLIFVDDGESIGTIEKGTYTEVNVQAQMSNNKQQITFTPQKTGYKADKGMDVETMTIYGLSLKQITSITIQGTQHTDFSFSNNVLVIKNILISLTENISVEIQ